MDLNIVAKMNEFAAAMGICNLRHLDDEIAKRKKVADRYWERLESISGVRICRPAAGITSNYAYLPVVFEESEFGATRDDVFAALKQHDIFARKYFYPLITDFDCYRGCDGFDSSCTPVAKHVAHCVLTMPMYADLSLEDVDRICDITIACSR